MYLLPLWAEVIPTDPADAFGPLAAAPRGGWAKTKGPRRRERAHVVALLAPNAPPGRLARLAVKLPSPFDGLPKKKPSTNSANDTDSGQAGPSAGAAGLSSEVVAAKLHVVPQDGGGSYVVLDLHASSRPRAHATAGTARRKPITAASMASISTPASEDLTSFHSLTKLLASDGFPQLRTVGPAVMLIRATWLEQRAALAKEHPLSSPERRKLALPSRQQMPAAAVLSLPELERLPCGHNGELPLIAVTHCWLTESHPDPRCEHLIEIAAALQQLRQASQAFPDEVGVMLDFCSLYQWELDRPRTTLEDCAFAIALNSLQYFYAHQLVSIICITDVGNWKTPPFEERGWPNIELLLCAMIKPLDLVANGALSSSWPLFVMRGHNIALPVPVARREQMAAYLDGKIINSEGKLPSLLRAYYAAHDSAFKSVKHLDYAGRMWTDEQFLQVMQSLRMATQLRTLNLASNRINRQGATLLERAIRDSWWPSMLQITLTDNVELVSAGFATGLKDAASAVNLELVL